MTTPDTGRLERHAHLRWVPIPKMRVSALAQRAVNQARVDHLAATFDLEQIGTPTVNHRDSEYYLIDGQHRIEALKAIGWGDQQVQCWTYEGLTEADEAEIFLKLNDYLAVSAYDRYHRGVVAGRDIDCDIDRIVRANALVVSGGLPGAIRAVGTLRKVYVRAGGPTLGRALRIIRDAYGDPGLEWPVIDGIGHLCERYNGELIDADAAERPAANPSGFRASGAEISGTEGSAA